MTHHSSKDLEVCGYCNRAASSSVPSFLRWPVIHNKAGTHLATHSTAAIRAFDYRSRRFLTVHALLPKYSILAQDVAPKPVTA